MKSVSLTEYVEDLFPFEDDLLQRMREEATAAGLPAIQIGAGLARLLQFLVLQQKPLKILEIGTLFGYSAVVMARAAPHGARIVTLEANPRHAELARSNLARAGLENQVDLREGDGLESLRRLQGEVFDFVFIDANKDGYPDYLRLALKLTRPGSMIVADNIWRQGAVLAPEDAVTGGAAAFNEEMARNSNLYSIVVPTRDCSDAVSISLVLA